MATWGSVQNYVQENYEVITQESAFQELKKVLEPHIQISGYSYEALRKAYARIKARVLTSSDSELRSHGNCVLTKGQEAQIVGYLLMRSETACAERVEAIRDYSHEFLDPPIHINTARAIEKKYTHFFRKTKEKPMEKA